MLVYYSREIHQYEIIDTRWGADFQDWTFSEHRNMTWKPGREWQVGEWHHISLVWDAAETAGVAAVMAANLYPAGDALVLTAGREPGTEKTLMLSAGQKVHLITEPLTEDAVVTRVGVGLAVEDFTEETVVLLQGHDTLMFNRELFEFDMRFQPAPGRRTLLLELELREPVALRAGQSFWVSVLFSRSGKLAAGSDATRLKLYSRSEKTVALPNLRQMLCDQFLHISEAQVWLSNPEPRKQFQAVDEVMTLAEHLMYFDPGNLTEASVYSWILNRARVWKPDIKDPLAEQEVSKPSVTGPDWAVWSRESLLALRQHVDWWIDEREQILFRHEPVAFRVPPRQVYVLEINQLERIDEDIRYRPDLAMAPGDAVANNGTVRVIIHNIGGADTLPALLRLVRNGQTVTEKMIPSLAAPLDLHPRRVTVEFSGIDDPAGLIAVVDPDKKIDEITRVNNQTAVIVASPE